MLSSKDARKLVAKACKNCSHPRGKHDKDGQCLNYKIVKTDNPSLSRMQFCDCEKFE